MVTYFLIESQNGIPSHDFGYTMFEAVNYHKWYYKEESNYDCHLFCGDIDKNSENLAITMTFLRPEKNRIIPVGSIEFAQKFMKLIYNVDLFPINIPSQLRTNEFLDRNLSYIDYTEDWSFAGRDHFIKEIGTFKGYADVSDPATILPAGSYYISGLLDIISEYRCFVYNKSLVGIQYYSGDFTTFPDIHTINKMMKTFTNCPRSYTLDVAITRTHDDLKTVVIEAHDIFSCGLYGFSNYDLLTKMYISWYNECMAKKK